jgi:hypothetical protein
MVECCDREGELAHRVKRWRTAVDDLLDKIGYLSTGSPVPAQLRNLLLGRNLTSEKEPEKAFRERFGAAWCGW